METERGNGNRKGEGQMKAEANTKTRYEVADPVKSMGIALFCMFVVSLFLLMLLAFLLYKFDLGAGAVRGGMIAVYVISGMTGGLVIGKRMKKQKFVWGLAGGLLYFVILLLFSLLMKRQLDFDFTNVVTTLILCGASGMAGGMIS